MKCVILCAGEGTRLRPLTEDTPKPLVEVDSQTLLSYSLEYAQQVGVSEYHLVVGYKKQQVISEIGDEYKGVSVHYHTQSERNGLAHALTQVDAEFDEHYLVLLADIIYESFPTQELQQNTDSLTLVSDTVPPSEAHKYGVCEFDSTQSVCDLVEKPDTPPSNIVLAGTYIVPPSIQKYCSEIEPSDRGEYEITDAIARYMQDTGTEPVLVRPDSWRVDVVCQQDLETAEQKLQEQPPTISQ